MTTVSQPKKHILFVDGIRAVAALFIIMHHAVLQQFNPGNINTLTGVKKMSVQFLFQGHLAVDFFIIISGYSLMLSVINSNYTLGHGVWGFYKRRAIRILPPYYLALLFSLLLVYFFIGQKTGTHWDISLPVNTKDIATHIILVHDFFVSHANKINHAFWSIAVECRIYLLFPLLLFMWRKTNALVTLAACVVAVFAMFVLLRYLKTFYPDIDISGSGVNPYLVLFAIGMLSADVCFSTRGAYNKIKQLPWGVLSIAAIILFSVVKVITKTIENNSLILTENGLDVLFGTVAFCVLNTCGTYKKGSQKVALLARILSWRPLVFIGTFSYTIYLFHAPLIQLLYQYVLLPIHLSAYTTICLLATAGTAVIVAISYIFYLACEQPFLRLLKKKKMPVAVFEAVESPAP